MIAYKLLSMRKDGSLGPLFINKRQRIKIGVWYNAEPHRKKGYAFRPGWHAFFTMDGASHLKKKIKREKRVWVKCEVMDFVFYDRPVNQGQWILAQKLKVIEIIE